MLLSERYFLPVGSTVSLLTPAPSMNMALMSAPHDLGLQTPGLKAKAQINEQGHLEELGREILENS